MKRIAVKVVKTERGTWEPVETVGKLLLESLTGDTKVGEYCRLILEKWSDNRSGRQFRYFMALVTRVSHHLGVAKADQIERYKCDFGVSTQYGEGFVPPTRPGRFCQPWPRERPGEFWFIVSLNDYTMHEMAHLIEGTKQHCYENSVDIDDLEVE
uniref:Uncharacterized protein n=1 Tax=viral metagenome TaxID=1070528 RepID=A0A6M3LCB6_9ZZZZ